MKSFNHQQPLTCEKSNLRSWCWDLFYAIQVWSSVAKRKLSNLRRKYQPIHQLKLANKDIRAGLIALIDSTTVNGTRYAGLICIGILAPLSTVFYRVFDEPVRDMTWYHVNNYYLFHALGVHCFYMFFTTVGLLLVLPSKYMAEYWLSPFVGYPIIKAVLIYYCESNAEWHQSFDIGIYASIILTGISFTLGLKYFAWLWAHKTRVLDCRMDGLFQTPIDPDQKEKMLLLTWNEIKATKKEY